jgi:hypothetical protein
MKKEKSKTSLKLLTKPDDTKSFGEWNFVWLTDLEVPEYKNRGFVRVKDLEKKGY